MMMLGAMMSGQRKTGRLERTADGIMALIRPRRSMSVTLTATMIRRAGTTVGRIMSV